MDLDRRISSYLASRGEEGRAVTTVTPLAGDASDRRYYRVLMGSERRVLSLMPQPFDPSLLPFLNVAELLRAVPIRIPRIHDVCGELGIILLEDLGDDLLQRHLDSASLKARKRLYFDALSIIARLQIRGRELRDDRFIPYRLAFDKEKLLYELFFFVEHFLEAFRSARLRNASRSHLAESFDELAEEIAGRPRVLCHRDFHARNLMVTDGAITVIDFQDARMGPASYDLASLLNDSYVEHSPDFLLSLRDEFQRLISPASLNEEFDATALQRNLKALGTFGFQLSVRGNEVYRRYIPHTLRLVRENLERNPRRDSLRRTLAAYLPEIG